MSGLRRQRRSFLQYVADNNPFYLLSAASMLLASVLLSNSTSWQPIGLSRLVGLIATLGVYELLLVGLGLFLIARRSTPLSATARRSGAAMPHTARDGVMLLVLEAFFLADIGFLASEAYQHGMTAGLAISGTMLLLGVVKLAAIFRVLRLPLASPAFAGVLATLVLLLGHPAILKWASDANNGRVSMGLMYAAWWAAAGLIAAFGLTLRHVSPVQFRGRRPATAWAGIGHVLAGVLLVSLVAHLGTAHWVYKSNFSFADLSPVLAAATVVAASIPNGRYYRRPDAAALCFLMPAAAILMALDAPTAMTLVAGPIKISATALGGMAAYLALVDSFAARYFVQFATAGVLAGAVYALGPAYATLQQWAAAAYRAVVGVIEAMLPRTQTAWGVLAAVGAFAMLAVGAAVSLLRPKDAGPFDSDSDGPGGPNGPTGGPGISPNDFGQGGRLGDHLAGGHAAVSETAAMPVGGPVAGVVPAGVSAAAFRSAATPPA